MDDGLKPEPGGTPVFEVAILYEQPALARRAVELCDKLERGLGPAANLRKDLWRFDVLDEPMASTSAVAHADHAHMVIVAMQDGNEPPTALQNWLRAWAHRLRSTPLALVALLASDAAGATAESPTRRCLQSAATEAGADFFVREVPAGTFGSTPASDTLAEREHNTSTILRSILDRPLPAPRWGINE